MRLQAHGIICPKVLSSSQVSYLNFQYLLPAIKDTLSVFIKSRLWHDCSPLLDAGITIKYDFFGINIAPSSDARVDDYIVARLKEAHIQHVRMDFTYNSLGHDAERLLNHILTNGFQVMLDLLPSFADATAMASDADAQERWRQFVADVARVYGQRVVCFEIGATPNRGRWSGFEPHGYLVAWQIAAKQLAQQRCTLAGANVSDFEPVNNIALLAAMKRQHYMPAIHTDNLFVERVVEPEAYDHRVLGQWMTNILKLNLVKKARILKALSDYYGAQYTMCTYTCWTTKRLSRWSDNPEQKKADYLVRYLVLASASGALDRVYWGPLICNRDGLISDGADNYPQIDNVSFYQAIRGDYKHFQVQKAFYVLVYVVKKLSGASCMQAVNADNGIHHFIFADRKGIQLHITWVRDRMTIPLSLLYKDQQLEGATFLNGQGEALPGPVLTVSERPLFIQFSAGDTVAVDRQKIKYAMMPLPTTRFLSIDGVQFVPWSNSDWQGAIAIKPGEDVEEKARALLPDNLPNMPVLATLRNSRNIVWRISNPLDTADTLAIKQNRAHGLKKLTYYFKASKGQRHWDNASEMIRLGVNSPMPVAYFERRKYGGVRDNYYLCEYVANAFSARDAFIAFSQGKTMYNAVSKPKIFQLLARYVCNMHNRMIIHCDLSGGNLLMTVNPEGAIDIRVIDIGRALTGRHNIKEKHRLIDLMRLCYKLDWPNRHLFMQYYFAEYGKPFVQGWQRSLQYYDSKQKLKRLLSGHWKK